mmetsp:Transcript_34280/g.92830  ORF Transcript_34280/g.92830 Transcript_34280/m.92830 type:complete len:111 (+) Transcript_34280:56-388(+)
MAIHGIQLDLCRSKSLHRCLLPEMNCLRFIFRYSLSNCILHSQIALPNCAAQPRSPSIVHACLDQTLLLRIFFGIPCFSQKGLEALFAHRPIRMKRFKVWQQLAPAALWH